MAANAVQIWLRLPSQGILDLHQKLVRSELPALPRLLDGPSHVVVVRHEQVAEGMEGPPQAGGGAERPALVVVLQEVRHLELGRELELGMDPVEELGESSGLE